MWKYNRHFKRTLKTFKSEEMKELSEQYTTDNAVYAKYFRADKTVEFSLNRVLYLDLDKKPRQRILDLGAGFGTFGRIASDLGHSYEGVDLPPNDSNINTLLFKEAFQILNPQSKRWECEIKRQQTLPFENGTYDLITAFQIVFHLFNTPNPWDEEDWIFFLKQLDDLLADGGRVCLHFSKPNHSDRFRPEFLDRIFSRVGADFDGPYILMKKSSTCKIKSL